MHKGMQGATIKWYENGFLLPDGYRELDFAGGQKKQLICSVAQAGAEMNGTERSLWRYKAERKTLIRLSFISREGGMSASKACG